MSEDVDWVGRILLFFALAGTAGSLSLVSAFIYAVWTFEESIWVLRWIVMSAAVVFVCALLAWTTLGVSVMLTKDAPND